MSQQATNLPSTYLSKTPKHHCQDQHRHWSGTNQEIGILFPLASGHRCRDLHPLASLPHLPLWLEVPRHSTCDFFVFVEVISPGHPCWETRFLLYLIIQIYQHKLTNKHTSVSGISIFTIPNKKNEAAQFFRIKTGKVYGLSKSVSRNTSFSSSLLMKPLPSLSHFVKAARIFLKQQHFNASHVAAVWRGWIVEHKKGLSSVFQT